MEDVIEVRLEPVMSKILKSQVEQRRRAHEIPRLVCRNLSQWNICQRSTPIVENRAFLIKHPLLFAFLATAIDLPGATAEHSILFDLRLAVITVRLKDGFTDD